MLEPAVDGAVADHFKLEFSADNGTVPPPYRRETELSIDDAGHACYLRLHGYDRSDSSQCFRAEFDLDSSTRRAFLTNLKQLAVFAVAWREPARPPVGGSQVYLKLEHAGQILRLPAHPVAEQRELVDQLRELVMGLVPQSVLDARRDWEAGRDSE